MKKALFIVILLSITLIGCATVYTHSYKNSQDFERDKYECRLTAEQSAANWGSHGNIFMIVDETKRCLEFRYGWEPVKQ